MLRPAQILGFAPPIRRDSHGVRLVLLALTQEGSATEGRLAALWSAAACRRCLPPELARACCNRAQSEPDGEFAPSMFAGRSMLRPYKTTAHFPPRQLASPPIANRARIARRRARRFRRGAA